MTKHHAAKTPELPRLHPTARELAVPSADGVAIRAQVAGHGPLRWLLPPGLGTPAVVWEPLIDRFAGLATVATWDMRGCFGSGRPAAQHLTVADHAADGLAVMAALGWQDAPVVVGGWSLGVQISLELCRHVGARVQGVVLLCGTFEKPLASALPFPGAARALPKVLKGLIRSGPWLDKHVAKVARHPVAPKAAQVLKIVDGGDPTFVAKVVHAIGAVELSRLAELAQAASAHSARDVLPQLRAPVLILAGDKDALTPLDRSQEMHRLLPGSELQVFRGATHYAILEQTDAVLAAMERFLRRLPQ